LLNQCPDSGWSAFTVTTAFPDQTFKGKVRLVAPEAVQENEITQFQVRVLLDERAAKTSNPVLTVNFIAGRLNNALVVPTTAIISKDGKTGVLMRRRDQPSRK